MNSNKKLQTVELFCLLELGWMDKQKYNLQFTLLLFLSPGYAIFGQLGPLSWLWQTDFFLFNYLLYLRTAHLPYRGLGALYNNMSNAMIPLEEVGLIKGLKQAGSLWKGNNPICILKLTHHLQPSQNRLKSHHWNFSMLLLYFDSLSWAYWGSLVTGCCPWY